jgi:hypothetical protein
MQVAANVFAWSWIIGSVALFFVTVVFGLKMILAKKWFGGILLLVSIAAIFFNPVVNIIVTDNYNQHCCGVALENASSANYVGRQAEVVKKVFGSPYRVDSLRSGEQWSYRTCPWFVLCPDEFLAFEINDGKVVSVYIQVD